MIDKIKNFLRKGGIRLRLTLLFSGLFLILTALLSGILVTIQGRSLKSKSFEVCEAIQIGLSASSRESISTGNLVSLRDILTSIKKAELSGLEHVDVYSILREKVGKKESSRVAIVASTDLERTSKEPDPIYSPFLEQSRTKKEAWSVQTTNESGKAVFLFLSPVYIQIAGKERWLGLISIEYLEDAITKATRDAIFISAIVSFIVLLIAVLFIYRVGGNITAPILQIAEASRKVGAGDFNLRLVIETKDELEDLSKDFNLMVKGLNEKLKMEKFISKSAAEMISGTTLGEEIVRNGKYEEIAFLFSDVRGFTSMSEKKKPDEVVEILNHYLDLQSMIIKENGGDIDKYVGDEMMAIFRGEHKRLSAVKSAVEIQEAMASENSKRIAEGLDAVQVGVGLNVGEVIVGSMGSRFRMDFTCIGDPVNLAARLCSAAEPGAVLSSAAMLEEKDYAKNFLAEELPPIKVKGKEKPIPIYRLKRIPG